MTVDPIQTVLAVLEAHGCRPRQSGDGWVAHCPAHDDRNPSLSVGIGREGQVLLKCHAGCPPKSVVAALGLEMADLWRESLHPSHGNGKKPVRKPDKAERVYPTAREALLAYGLGEPKTIPPIP